MAGIKEVAKLAGVSVATVSRVLNDSGNVLPETREKVCQAIGKLNYQPNILARNLRRSETKLILAIIPSISNMFFSEVVKGMHNKARKYGYNLLLCDTEEDHESLNIYLNLLRSHQADGVIFVSSAINNNIISEILKTHPIVQCSEINVDLDLSYVTIDNKLAAYQAVQHLIKTGKKRVALINGFSHHSSTKLRFEGYKQALLDNNIEYCDDLVCQGNYGLKSGFRAMRQLLNLKHPPDGVLAGSDMMAIGAIKYIRQTGMRVPEDIGVVGFDNTQVTNIFEPSVTSISQPMYDMGQCAVEILMKKINNPGGYDEKLILEHDLVIRHSTV